jgi:hypothetical protein
MLYKFLAIFIIFFLMCIYLYIIIKNNIIFNKNSNKKIDSIIPERYGVAFEIFQICVLIIVPIILYKQKQYIIAFAFLALLVEHINQVVFCYRQELNSLFMITIAFDIMFAIYAYIVKCYWVIPLFIIGTLIHTSSLYYKKSFSPIVCINNK